MKSFIHFIVAVFCFVAINYINSYSNNSLRLKNLHYENSLGEKGVTHFYYSLKNKNYKAKWELLNGSRYSINYHFLNDDGSLIRKYREFSDNITSNNFYKYDDTGNLIEDYFERSDGVKGIVWYEYKDGKKSKAICRGLNGWFYGIIAYQYQDDIISKGLIYKSGKEIGYIDYNYDEDGNLIEEYWDFGKWNQTFRYEYENTPNQKPDYYTYSSAFLNPKKKFIIKKENYNWNDEKGGPSYYEYEGNKLVRKTYRYDSLETNTTYEYDEHGHLMKSFRKYSDGRKAEFSYHYNENGRLIRRLFHGEKGFVGTESYQYNIDGTLKLAEWLNFDTWISGTIVFENDENSNLILGKFKGNNKLSAEIIFKADENGNLININWKFNTGHTQTYKFNYKKL